MKNVFHIIILICLLLPALWGSAFGAFLSVSLTMKPVTKLQTSDAIIVLTGGSGRIEEALRLFANGKAHDLYISGVDKKVSKSDILSEWKKEITLPSCCITIDQIADTTIGNANESAKWIEANNVRDIRLVTTDYHILRAWLEFKNRMPDLRIVLHPIKPPQDTYQDIHRWSVLVKEFHKLVYRFVVITLEKTGLQ